MTPIPHVWQPIERATRVGTSRMVKAGCSCGWQARRSRIKVVDAIKDHEFHVWHEENRVARAAVHRA